MNHFGEACLSAKLEALLDLSHKHIVLLVIRFYVEAAENEESPSLFGLGLPEERQLPTLPPGGAVPSAMAGLTSLFGMGRGGAPPL